MIRRRPVVFWDGKSDVIGWTEPERRVLRRDGYQLA
jgi:hypothetical protein